jgi:hypothetical protein
VVFFPTHNLSWKLCPPQDRSSPNRQWNEVLPAQSRAWGPPHRPHQSTAPPPSHQTTRRWPIPPRTKGQKTNQLSVSVLLPNMLVLCPPFPRHGPRVYTDRGNIPALFRTPIYPLRPYTYGVFHFDVNEIRRLRGSRGRTWSVVWLRCPYNRDNAVIST